MSITSPRTVSEKTHQDFQCLKNIALLLEKDIKGLHIVLAKLQAVLFCSLPHDHSNLSGLRQALPRCTDTRSLVCILRAESIALVLARLQTGNQNRMKATQKGGLLRRMSWKGSAGAEVVMAEKLQEVRR